VEQSTGIVKVVEIGIWQGRSTIYLADKIRQSGKPIFFYAFDTFEGSPEHSLELKAIAGQGKTLEGIFRENLAASGCGDYVRAIKQDSVTGARRFEDASLDMVFLDGQHEYEAVKADIEAWLPKIKPGGLLAGDDYQSSWPGVIKAVDELPEHTVTKWWQYRLPG
jgi:predicted O-methyltransferase YrrM